MKTNTLLQYFIWAIVQHVVTISPFWFLNINLTLKVALSWIVFTLAHFPNYKLMLVTGVSGLFAYFTFGIIYIKYGIFSVEMLYTYLTTCFIHATVGRLLLTLGWDLRVLWMHPKWKSYFK